MARPRSAVRRRRIDPAAEETLRRRQAYLTALSSHPSWDELQDEVERKAGRLEKVVLAKVLGGTPRDQIDPMELQWIKGFVAGMRWFAAVPTQAEASLQRYLEAQGISMEGVEE